MFLKKWPPVAILDVQNHFVSHFLPFQINTTIFILDVRNSLSVAFLAILDQYATFYFLDIFDKMAAVGHFGCPKFTLDHISGHFRSIQIFFFFFIFFTKLVPVAILDVRKSLSISFLSISHRYATLIFVEIFDKMDDVVNLGCPNFTFDRIFGHFRSIRNFYFFWKFLSKWLPAAILDVRNSLSIAFLAISDRSAIMDFRNSLSIAILAISDRYRFFFSAGHFGCLKITLDRISGYFRLIGDFGCPKFTFDGISCHFRFIRNLKFLDKMAAGGHFGWDDDVIELVRDIWMSNACVKFEERSLNPSKVIALTKL